MHSFIWLELDVNKKAYRLLNVGESAFSLYFKKKLNNAGRTWFGLRLVSCLFSLSFTWSSSRMNRNMITVMTGQVVDSFDNDFRELYAMTAEVDLYREFNITKPPISTPVRKPNVEKISLPPVSKSRFQVPVGESKGVDVKVPVHKYHNPKYSLVFGNSTGITGSLQDLSCIKESLANGVHEKNGLQSNNVHATKNGTAEVHKETPQRGSSPEENGDEDGRGSLKRTPSFGTNKERSSFRHFLKGRGSNHGTDTIHEDVVTPQSPTPTLTPTPTPTSMPKLKPKLTPTPILTTKVSGTNGISEHAELEDSFEINDKSSPLKYKPRKPSKVMQRSVSLMTLNGGDEDGTSSNVSFHYFYIYN